MSTEPIVIEAEHFRTEQAALMVDPVIVRMAADLHNDPNAPKGESILAWLDSYEGMIAAKNVAGDRGAKFQSIGGPARAVRALLVIEQSR